MFKMTSKLFLIFLLLCFGNSAYNQNNWEQVILSDSIDIKSLYFYEEDIYLATHNGVYYSNNNFQSINYIGLDENIIDCVLEVDGSYKIGNYIPGKKIPILSEKKLYNDPPDFVILFSWHIASELKSNLKKKGFKGKFIIPLPYPKIEN